MSDALVEVRIPTVERERADARPVRLRQKFGGGARRFGEISAYLPGIRYPRLLRHRVRQFNGRKIGIVFERACEFGIGMPVEIKQAMDRVVARRHETLRRPRKNRGRTSHHKRCHRPDGK